MKRALPPRHAVALALLAAASACSSGAESTAVASRGVVSAAADPSASAAEGPEQGDAQADAIRGGPSPASGDGVQAASGGAAGASSGDATRPMPGLEAAVLQAPPQASAVPRLLGDFVSPRTTVIYAEPRWGAVLRGRVDPGHPFMAIEAAVGEGCDELGWARVQLDGYACLRHASTSTEPPEPLPRVRDGEILPFVYAKPKADRKGVLLAEVPRYRSVAHLRRKATPVDNLVGNRQYAFVEFTKRWGGVYVDGEERAIPAANMELQKPSEHFGRRLNMSPVADGLTAAWSVSLPAVLVDQVGKRAKPIGSIPYHEPVDVDPTPIRAGGETWHRVPGRGKDGADAFVDASQIRYWDPGPKWDEAPTRELWIDVDIDQQMLALRQGDEVLFLTLVSTGTGKHPTPRGLFRIRNKLALGKMENRPDEPESYYVEEVPWVQYFYKRFAFHTTYWHRSLGRRRSHGCINLAPRAAAYIFAQTSPMLPDGWTSAWEYEDAVGTVVRIRNGDDPMPDKRRPLGDQEDEGDEPEPPEADAADDEPGSGP
ncbi:MAG: L,D-transpeptidase [Nannocystaceae bacterium]